jgi:pyruvate dehydrogenase E1 component
VVRWAGVDLPEPDAYGELKQGSGKHEVATTMAFVRLLRDLLKHDDLGKRIIPIIPDEARTFGMDSWFRDLKIYSPHGQNYEPVDREMLLAYVESTDGQIIHEGITEAGSMGTFSAAGSAYAAFGEPLLPVYIFYSMFGFQRTGDSIWSAADQRCRGFLLGATAGRTTLNGEGLQHQDGHSLLLAATNPAVEAYDAAFAFELAVIAEDAINRMLGDGGAYDEQGRERDVMYYLTLYNEPVAQPPMPEDLDPAGIIRGLYRFAGASGDGPGASILASGSAMPAALEAQRLLAEDWGVAAEVWSAPGWVGLHRDGLAVDEWNRLHPDEEPRRAAVTEALDDAAGPVVAVTDYQRAVPGLIAPWVPGRYATLGTDGFGRSDTRPALRRHFRVDAPNTVLAVLVELAAAGAVDRSKIGAAIDRYDLRDAG